jgi:hypothetical protein
MSNSVQVEGLHFVNVLPPVDVTGGAAGARFHMRYYKKALVALQVGVSAAAFTKILVKSCSAASAGTATAIAFSYYACETDASDVLGARTASLAAGVTPSAANNIMYVIEVDAAELLDGHDWVEVSVTNGTNSVIASALAVLSGTRYGQDQSVTVVA